MCVEWCQIEPTLGASPVSPAGQLMIEGVSQRDLDHGGHGKGSRCHVDVPVVELEGGGQVIV